MTQYIGIDLAWGGGTARKPANESGLAVIDEFGAVSFAGWARGIDAVRYKRLVKSVPPADARARRAIACDDLIRRVASLDSADPPLLLSSNEVTKRLMDDPSPLADSAYKHREDLLDAVLCAWTAALWHRFGGRTRPGARAGR